MRTAREEQGISIDQAIKETHISRRYLIALEEEDFDVFAADAYLVGFLRNYSDYLGLLTERILGQYKNYKLNETPAPLAELIGPPRGSIARKVVLWAILILLPVTAGIFSLPYISAWFKDFREQRLNESVEEKPLNQQIRPTLPLWEGEVYPGDTLILEDSEKDLTLLLSNGKDHLNLDAGETGNWSMLPGEEIYFPGNDGLSQWRVYLKESGLAGNGAIIEIQQLSRLASEDLILTEELVITPPSGVVERQREPRIILSAGTPVNYSIRFEFQSFCLLRYQVDNGDALENTFTDGDAIQLNVNNAIKVWASNAGSFNTRINDEELRFGRRGEVTVGVIRWLWDKENGIYNLTLFPLY